MMHPALNSSPKLDTHSHSVGYAGATSSDDDFFHSLDEAIQDCESKSLGERDSVFAVWENKTGEVVCLILAGVTYHP